MNDIKLFLAEGENHVRQAIQLSLDHMDDLTVIGNTNHTESLLAQITMLSPDVLLLDWFLPGMNPQRLLSVIRKFCPETLIVATVLDPEGGKKALAYGVDGFIIKGSSPENFIASLQKELGIHTTGKKGDNHGPEGSLDDYRSFINNEEEK